MAVVRLDHWCPVGVQFEPEGGMQEGPQLPKEVDRILEEFLWGQEHYQHQHPLGQLLRGTFHAIQPIPATFLSIAALVTPAIAVMISTVLLVQRAASIKRGKLDRQWSSYTINSLQLKPYNTLTC